MLQLKIGNTYVATKDLEISVILKSPLPFEGKRVSGSYIFNFQVPYTDALKQEAKYIHRPASKNGKPGKLPFLLTQGPLKYAGFCTIKQVSEKTVEVSAPINTGNLAALLGDLKMSDVDMGGVRDSNLPVTNIVDARMATELKYTIGQGEPAPFTQEDWIHFDNIILDVNNEIHATGINFTCSQPGLFVFKYSLDFLILSKRSEFRTWINGNVVDAAVITQTNNIIVVPIALNFGDIVHYPNADSPLWKSQINGNTTVPDGDIPYNRYWKPFTL